MAPLRFELVAVASAMLLHGTYSMEAEESGATRVLAIGGGTAQCVEAMNKARAAVGFKPFTEVHTLLPELPNGKDPMGEEKNYWEQVCEAILPSQEARSGTPHLPPLPNGTYAYFGQTEDSENCPGAVEYWKAGLELIGTKRPGKFIPKGETLGEAPFNTMQAMSFASLYNPHQEANAHCVFLVCRGEAPDAEASGVQGAPFSKANAVICLTSPKALEEGKEPYTEEQWKHIVGH